MWIKPVWYPTPFYLIRGKNNIAISNNGFSLLRRHYQWSCSVVRQPQWCIPDGSHICRNQDCFYKAGCTRSALHIHWYLHRWRCPPGVCILSHSHNATQTILDLAKKDHVDIWKTYRMQEFRQEIRPTGSILLLPQIVSSSIYHQNNIQTAINESINLVCPQCTTVVLVKNLNRLTAPCGVLKQIWEQRRLSSSVHLTWQLPPSSELSAQSLTPLQTWSGSRHSRLLHWNWCGEQCAMSPVNKHVELRHRDDNKFCISL